MNIKEARTIGIIFSVPSEGSILAGKAKKKKKGAGLCYESELLGRPIVLSVSGMGKVNAAHAATRLILACAPCLVMNIGIGGAYPSAGLKVGDIAVAEKEIYGDEGIMLRNGFHGTSLINIPLIKKTSRKYFNEFIFNKRLVDKTVKASQVIARDASLITARKGAFVTVSTCTGTRKRARELEDRYGAICENMEGAAIAHICTMYDIPMIELRGISNIVENRDKEKWNIILAAENCQQAVLEFLKAI